MEITLQKGLRLLFILVVFTSFNTFGQGGKQLEQADLEERYALFQGLNERDKGNYAEAIPFFLRCLEINPKSDVAHYELAKIYSALGKVAEVQKHALQAKIIAPKNKYYVEFLADAYAINQEFNLALQTWKELEELDPNNIIIYFAQSNLYAKLNKPKKALAVLEKVEQKFGDNAELWYQKVDLVLSAGSMSIKKRLKNAESISLQGIKKFPGNPLLLNQLGEIYEVWQKPVQAIRLFEQLKEQFPQSGQLAFLLSKLYADAGRQEMAHQNLLEAFSSKDLEADQKLAILIEYYKQSENNKTLRKQAYELISVFQKSNPNEAEPYVILGDFLNREGKTAGARDAYLKSIDYDASKHVVWRQLLFAHGTLNDEDALIRDGKRAVELFPDLSIFYLLYGQALYAKDSLELALQVLKDGVDFSVFNDLEQAEFYFYIGSIHHDLGNHKESDSAFDKSLALYPDNAFLLNNYSYYLALRNERLDKAEKMSRRSLELDDKRSSFCDTYGFILFKLGRFEKSLSWFERALELGAGGSPEVLEHYGDALHAAGQKAKAKEIWKKALLLDESNERLKQKIEAP